MAHPISLKTNFPTSVAVINYPGQRSICLGLCCQAGISQATVHDANPLLQASPNSSQHVHT